MRAWMNHVRSGVVAAIWLMGLNTLAVATVCNSAARAADPPPDDRAGQSASAGSTNPDMPLPAVLRIGGLAGPSRVPDPWRQGVMPHGQSVSAVDISSDGQSVGVATLAFNHDHNYWLLDASGQVVERRYLQPWAPFQVTVLPDARAVAVGLAYSRFTGPNPTVALLETGSTDEPFLLEDAWWESGWLRYGAGDWRSGWPVSMIGDQLARAGHSVITVRSHDGAFRLRADARREPFTAMNGARPLRMAVSRDARLFAQGFIVPDFAGLDEQTRAWMRRPPGLLSVGAVDDGRPGWNVAPWADAPLVDKPPEPAEEFPAMADDFNMLPRAMVPMRAALSVALNDSGSIAALTEYGGWIRVKRERGIGGWNPKFAVPFCPRQRGRLRVVAEGDERVNVDLPTDGLFEVAMPDNGSTVWCWPMSWFARGLAGQAWLPTDAGAATLYRLDVDRTGWIDAWRFPDAVSDVGVHPDGSRLLVSCWDGVTYLVGRDGKLLQRLAVGQPARVRWADDGRSAVIGTQGGDVWSIGADGSLRWKTSLPVADVPLAPEPARPVINDVPIYAVGRIGKEHAYVGDIWLVKGPDGAFIVDTAGTSAVPMTWQRMRAAGVELSDVSHALLTHTHGDHVGGAHLWRAQGLKIVAPATAALSATWLPPTWSDYGVWPPCRIDQPLPLANTGDEAELTVAGLKVRAVFVPGHSFDSVIYLVDFGDKRVAFTGDIGFVGQDIVRKCWGDTVKAALVLRAIREQVLPFQPDYVFTGHDAQAKGVEFLEMLVRTTEETLAVRRSRE